MIKLRKRHIISLGLLATALALLYYRNAFISLIAATGLAEPLTGIPIISSWADVILIILFGIPVVLELYRFLSSNQNFASRIRG